MKATLWIGTFISCHFLIACVERNEMCVTPNGETARCVSYDSCPVIRQAIMAGSETARKFARDSECGFDKERLICCGTKSFLEERPRVTELADRKTCGYQTVDDRVIGGETTEIGEFPWMALLGYRDSRDGSVTFKCGGTLINNRYVLTAAHCLKIRKALGVVLDVVRLGEWQISTANDCHKDLVNAECADPIHDLHIEKQIAHPSYSKKSGNNDIALLKLERNIKFSDFIRPICLPNSDLSLPKIGSLLVVSGWGTTENGTTADTKLKLLVPLVATTECAVKVRINGDVTDNQVCAGGEGNKDTCSGDSGGPLMAMEKDLNTKIQWRQEGIVSWGVGCGRKGYPGVYTRVSRYITWIVENLL